MIVAQIVAFVFWFSGVLIGGMALGNLIINVGIQDGRILEALAWAGIYTAAITFAGYCVGKEIGTWNKIQG